MHHARRRLYDFHLPSLRIFTWRVHSRNALPGMRRTFALIKTKFDTFALHVIHDVRDGFG